MTQTTPSPTDSPDLARPVTGDGFAVVGLQWGDEGKGKIIDVLAPRFDAVVRYNGGANAGHSVVFDGQRHALHLVPSGVFHPQTLAVIGNGVVVDPIGLLGEVKGLRDKGIDVSGLRLSDRAHLVLPYHKSEDAIRESVLAGQMAGAEDEPDRSIGTTKRGIGPAYADKAHRSASIRVGDLYRPDVLQSKLRDACALKSATFGALGHEAEAPTPEQVMRELAEASEALRPHVTDTAYLLHTMLRDGKRLLFEGANATLLDVDHGTYPFVTSSSTTSLGIPAGTGVPGRCVDKTLGILKAYATRVGAGPFPTELHDDTGDRIRERGREFGTTTGRPRRCGWLDLVAVRYSAMLNGATGLSLMLFDVLAGFDELKVCTAYEIDGERTTRFLPDAHDLERATPVYETLPGFSEEITGARSRTELPRAAQAYLDFIESFVGVPIEIVSVGPDREQTIGVS
ncbi:MAG: adenylosuccinate synthase [Planctomycetota bacterium]